MALGLGFQSSPLPTINTNLDRIWGFPINKKKKKKMNPNRQKTPLPFDLNVPLEDPDLNPNPNPNLPPIDTSPNPRETQAIGLTDAEESLKKDSNFADGPPGLRIQYNGNGIVHSVEDRLVSRNSINAEAELLAYDPWPKRKVEYTVEDGMRRQLKHACWDPKGKMIEPKELLELNPWWGMREENTEVFSEALDVVKRRGGEVHWVPMRNVADWKRQRRVPSLKDLCLRVLEDNPEEVESLEGLTDAMKDVLVFGWCRKRTLSKRLLWFYLAGSPERVRLTDLSLIAEGEFVEVFSGMNCEQLKVLQLDFCGHCMHDRVLRASLARFPNSFPSLTTVSLVGACRLSDDGLDALVTSAPLLSSVNLRECSLLTSDGIISLAVKLKSVLRELYLDDCQRVDALLILSALQNLELLEALSVARIQNVCDKFIYHLTTVLGPNLKELILADCQLMTLTSARAIRENCCHLLVLDIRNAFLLRDSALRFLASGCRSIQKLNLQNNTFSDEAVAAFLEASGGSLTELSLNKVSEVAGHTALTISLKCYKNLQSLDLSFCRKITDEALGQIVDSCSNLRELVLFGCTQITECFMNGHSNSNVEIIGLMGRTLYPVKRSKLM